MSQSHSDASFKGIIRSLGLVFGDIGTSPIYTLTVIFLITTPTREHIMGVLSLIFWTLIILVTAEYAWLAMSLSKKGEGGTIVLKEIIVPLLKSGRKTLFVTLLAYIGISLLIGDGVITPAISILSAVEGSLLIPGLEGLSRTAIICIAAGICIILFSFQKKGTEKVSLAFGPMMLVWFISLALSGIIAIWHNPVVIMSISPYYAFEFLTHNGIAGFFVLSEVILCATGGEALYADMGHLGRTPIVKAWYWVFAALLLNYLGQGAFLMNHPETKNVLFEMILQQSSLLYLPFLILSIIATIIASQAMISGMFSIVYQGIMTHMLPMFKIDYTSKDIRSQIYIGTVNWFLLISVLIVMVEFGESSKLAAAYGLAVTGTMTLTGIFMTWIFHLQGKRVLSLISLAVTIVDILYLLANCLKIPHGGYWSIIIAMFPFSMILLYTAGQRRLYKSLRPMKMKDFLERFNLLYSTKDRLSGSALFFVRAVDFVSPYVVRTMFTQEIIYDDNIFVSILRRDDPFGIIGFFNKDLAPGLRSFEIQMGYMEVIDVEAILAEAGITEKVIFYGLEDISSENPMWKLFAFIKKNTPNFVHFYKLPVNKLHGVVTRVEM